MRVFLNDISLPDLHTMLARRIQAIILLMIFLLSQNIHLPVIQVVGWAGMLVSYSRAYSFRDALTMTFDGQHPCPLCKFVESQNVADKKEITACEFAIDRTYLRPGSLCVPEPPWKTCDWTFIAFTYPPGNHPPERPPPRHLV